MKDHAAIMAQMASAVRERPEQPLMSSGGLLHAAEREAISSPARVPV